MQFKDLIAALALPAIALAAPTPQWETEGESIVGGETAAAGDFPFIVSLQKSGSHFCGGSLLNANTVVTAAHCAVNQQASLIKVRAGSLNRNSGGTLVQVSSIKINSGYNSNTLTGDVAIFKLATAIPTSSTISYAVLAAAGNDPAAGLTTTTAGWGTTSSGGSTLPTALRKVDVPVVSRSQCQADYPDSTISQTMFCAGLDAGGKDSCQGDSGGPIIEKSSKTLIGLVSWGEGCAAAGKPGVYTRIGESSIRTFITNNS